MSTSKSELSKRKQRRLFSQPDRADGVGAPGPGLSSLSPTTKETLNEVAQAKIRNWMHLVLVVVTYLAYTAEPRVGFEWLLVFLSASLLSAAGLYAWALSLQRRELSERHKIYQRAASILSDNTFITLTLFIGGEATAGIVGIYIWISVGYGVRYGVPYLHANLVASLAAFLVGAWFTPFWHARPYMVLGLAVVVVLVPLYMGWLIKQLHRAIQEREEAYRAKSEFVAKMSHELRTPLHGIISTSALLKGKASTPEEEELTRIITASSNTLLDLINRVLDISKFESGSIAIQNEPFDLNEVINDCSNIVLPQAISKGLDLQIYRDPEINPKLIGAPHQLKEVLLNLLGNAVKFTHAGYVAVRAHYEGESEGSIAVRIEISDTGSGIPKDQIERIFDPFMQGDNSKTRKHEGTGLGTSFARELVRLMGGEISVKSTEGVGSVFSIRIVFRKQAVQQNLRSFYPINLVGVGFDGEEAMIVNQLSKFGSKITFVNSIKELREEHSEPSRRRLIDGILANANQYAENLGQVSSALGDKLDARRIPVVGFGAAQYRAAAVSAGYAAYLSRFDDRRTLSSTLNVIFSFKEELRAPRAARDLSNTISLNILVADDNATNQRVAKMMLEEAGHSCKVVGDGESALGELFEGGYDIAILDMHMPQRDGIEVAKIYNFRSSKSMHAFP